MAAREVELRESKFKQIPRGKMGYINSYPGEIHNNSSDSHTI